MLTHFRAYDPGLGRWLSADPIGEAGGMNLYAYILGNPINGWDPLGLDVCYLVDDGNKAAAWQSHAAALIGNDVDGWIFMSYSPFGLDLVRYLTFADAQAAQTGKYDRYLRYPSTKAQDRDAKKSFFKNSKKTYTPFGNNCGHVAADAVKAGFPGFKNGEWSPKENYNNNAPTAPTSGPF